MVSATLSAPTKEVAVMMYVGFLVLVVAVLVDPAHIGQVVYRKTRIKFNVKTDDDYDGVKDNIRSDEGPWLDLIQKHSLWELT